MVVEATRFRRKHWREILWKHTLVARVHISLERDETPARSQISWPVGYVSRVNRLATTTCTRPPSAHRQIVNGHQSDARLFRRGVGEIVVPLPR